MTEPDGQRLLVPVAEAGSPQRLGDYELIARLNTGGMGEISLAWSRPIEGFEKLVVVKRMLPELARSPELVQMFLHEARLAATLQHPNIAQVYDVGLASGEYFLVMEFVHGEDVREMLRTAEAQQREIPLEVALSIITHVCAGLHHAHEKLGGHGQPLDIVHRDVAPSNVLVTYDGCVKLVDFGIARARTRTVETRSGSVRGKRGYLSPEQCRCQPLDRRSDIFGIAIVLYELTTQKKLYPGNRDLEVMKCITEEDAPPPSSRKPGYPPELERIVLRGLARDRDQRYGTAQELQLALENFAREHQLALSPIVVARFMEVLFAERISVWREAQGKGFLGQVLSERRLAGAAQGSPALDGALATTRPAIRKPHSAQHGTADSISPARPLVIIGRSCPFTRCVASVKGQDPLSNRACRFPAHGLPMAFLARHARRAV